MTSKMWYLYCKYPCDLTLDKNVTIIRPGKKFSQLCMPLKIWIKRERRPPLAQSWEYKNRCPPVFIFFKILVRSKTVFLGIILGFRKQIFFLNYAHWFYLPKNLHISHYESILLSIGHKLSQKRPKHRFLFDTSKIERFIPI